MKTFSYIAAKRTKTNRNACKYHRKEPPPQAKKLANIVPLEDQNRNNTGLGTEGTGSDERAKPDLPLAVMVRLIVLALQKMADPRGSSLKDIRRFLTTVGVIEESTDMRQAMIVALKLGAIARPVWAVKAGLYGRYVQGDGIPIFAGRKSRPKKIRHRSSRWITDSAKCKKSSAKHRKVVKKHKRRKTSTSSLSHRLQRKNRKRLSFTRKRKQYRRHC